MLCAVNEGGSRSWGLKQKIISGILIMKPKNCDFPLVFIASITDKGHLMSCELERKPDLIFFIDAWKGSWYSQ